MKKKRRAENYSTNKRQLLFRHKPSSLSAQLDSIVYTKPSEHKLRVLFNSKALLLLALGEWRDWWGQRRAWKVSKWVVNYSESLSGRLIDFWCGCWPFFCCVLLWLSQTQTLCIFLCFSPFMWLFYFSFSFLLLLFAVVFVSCEEANWQVSKALWSWRTWTIATWQWVSTPPTRRRAMWRPGWHRRMQRCRWMQNWMGSSKTVMNWRGKFDSGNVRRRAAGMMDCVVCLCSFLSHFFA